MEVEFDVSKTIDFPFPLFERKLGDYFIVLASEYPNWIILNEHEYKLFQYLKDDTLLNSLLNFQKVSGNDDEKIFSSLRNVMHITGP